MKRHCKPCKDSSIESKFKPVTHVIFDLDGVILDTERVYKESFRKTIIDYGCEFNEDVYGQASGMPSAYVATVAIDHYGLDVPVEDFVEKYRDYSRKNLNNINLIPGVDKLIRHLYDNGVPIAIASSSFREKLYQKMQAFSDLLHLFDPITCLGDDGIVNSKPAPDLYLVCASRFANQPSPIQCLVFEDSANGMKAALAAGMQVVLIPNENVTPDVQKLATVKIDSFDSMRPEWFGLPPFPNQT